MAASSRLVLYKEQYFYTTVPNIMIIKWESMIIMRMDWLRDNIILHKTSLSILVYKKVRIKIQLYTLPVKKTKYKKTFRSAFGAFSNIEDGTFREIT